MVMMMTSDGYEWINGGLRDGRWMGYGTQKVARFSVRFDRMEIFYHLMRYGKIRNGLSSENFVFFSHAGQVNAPDIEALRLLISAVLIS